MRPGLVLPATSGGEIRRGGYPGPRHHFAEPAGGRVPGEVYKCKHCSVEMKVLRRAPGKDEKLYRASPDDAFSLRLVPCVYKGNGGGRPVPESEEVQAQDPRGIVCDPPKRSATSEIPDEELLTLALGEILGDYHRRAEPHQETIARLEASLSNERAKLELMRQELQAKLSLLCRKAAGLDVREERG